MLNTSGNIFRLKERGVAFIGFTQAEIARCHTIYELWAGDSLIYLGVGLLRDLLSMKEPKKHGAFVKLVSEDTPLSIVVKYTGGMVECNNKRAAMLRDLPARPILNTPSPLNSRTSWVKCINDGRIYRSQLEAAEAYGVAQGNMSAHLSGRLKTLGGRVFEIVPVGSKEYPAHAGETK